MANHTQIHKTGLGDASGHQGTALVTSYPTSAPEHDVDSFGLPRDYFVATFTPSPMIVDGKVTASAALLELAGMLRDHTYDLTEIAERLQREGK